MEITRKDIDDIMDAALADGITYWCRKAKVVGSYLGECASDQISRGGSLILFDRESPDKWVLTPEKFDAGAKLYFENNADADMDDLDADMADQIVQYALFGELVFS